MIFGSQRILAMDSTSYQLGMTRLLFANLSRPKVMLAVHQYIRFQKNASNNIAALQRKNSTQKLHQGSLKP